MGDPVESNVRCCLDAGQIAVFLTHYVEDARQRKGLTKQFREKTGIEKWLTPSTAATIRKADEKTTSGEQHTRQMPFECAQLVHLP